MLQKANDGGAFLSITKISVLFTKRAEELKGRIKPYLDARKDIESGLELEEEFAKKTRTYGIFKATEEDWNDWHGKLKIA